MGNSEKNSDMKTYKFAISGELKYDKEHVDLSGVKHLAE